MIRALVILSVYVTYMRGLGKSFYSFGLIIVGLGTENG